ncbi:DUF699-domain-containing protein [Metschnikowia bicuspidata var. bicuspidata NRRL YB-4993]|uniref:RNA cytidine acetyltransferase n=1 Tax=Metschnikowia bicuspidata var. bicuspidata NRRL YB-4993 TaxID=869754 RepID=A0A1A0H688_9ASCO|nr:DUF699-domain-containing protein [Metschnikowia bicuspidata var. bicuspidata NRRL YB-4993]OBA19422.1 DUF699-domain-containing protein [Metschnikowia bicuspidata var. bicuspidata NRRL YB-4993]
MGKKAIDSRIPALIRNGVQEKQRSFFIIVGDKARNQLPNLHYLMMSADLKMNKSVLWAYKKQLLGFTSHRKKRETKIKKDIKRGIRDVNDQDPFEAFISNQNIRYVYYKETEKILGNTYGMCVLQDFEAITPNLLARTVETVEGGGVVVMLLKNMASLKQLYTMTMDIHARYRTEAHDDVVARFNERFLLSLGSCETCLVVDDELNVLPISGGKHVKPLPPADDDERTPAQKELAALKASLAEVQPAGSLVALARTVNQAQAILTFVDVISEKTLSSTVALTAGRGRGKSAALGVAIAGAVSHGYLNIFVTSPLPENLRTLFEFIFKGFDALGYTEHLDYDIVQLTNAAFHKAIVRVDVKRAHRQTIQYIAPGDAHVLGQAELLIIDEAAAIPLPVVRRLLGPYLVFMASTVNGYEGTGRLLSLKLIQQLRDQAGSRNDDTQVVSRDSRPVDGARAARTLREVVLDEPIRYAPGDPVERWLNKLLCLDASLSKNARLASKGTPHPADCNLFYVNRDTLFSYHPVSEAFLQKMMALYVASHYKNSPNDLQLMSDAPAHQLYVLLPPVDPASTRIPDPLCVVQLALEGEISKESVRRSLARGQRAGGDLIPWLVAQQFQDDEFASLSGARVVRIATNPDYAGMGYGSRALALLKDYFEGKFTDISEATTLGDHTLARVSDAELAGASLKDEVRLRDAKSLPPLLLKLLEKAPYALSYLGVSYGMTPPLHKFWKRAGFVPVYLRQTANELTGEHTSVMLHVLAGHSDAWLRAFALDFHKRFLHLMSYEFRKFPAVQALNVIESTGTVAAQPLDRRALDSQMSPFDLKRLDSYANNLLDYHVILDLMPLVAHAYFSRSAPGVSLSSVQGAILLAVGLQHKSIDDVSKELGLPASQAMAMFSKIVRKFSTYFRSVLSKHIEQAMPALEDDDVNDMNGDETIAGKYDAAATEAAMTRDLDAAGDDAVSELKMKQKELINALNLDKYAINDNAEEWDDSAAEKAVAKLGVASMKSKNKRKSESADQIYESEIKSSTKKSKKGKKGK